MGVFSVNENHFGLGSLPEVEMNEAYTTGVDMAIALVECKQNEFAVLQAGIKQDMIAAVTEDLEEREAINEATASDLLSKAKEILKKLIEKIKGIFHSFMAKINSFFMDSQELFKKYSGEIAKKNFSDFKLKVREFKLDKFNGLLDTTTVANTAYGVDVDNEDNYQKALENDVLTEKAIERVFSPAARKDLSIDDDLGNMEKEIEDYCFDDSETKDDFTSATIITSNWIGGLLNTKKFIENIEKTNKSTESRLEKLLANLDKETRKIAGTIGKDGTGYTAKNYALKRAKDGEKASIDDTASAAKMSVIAGASPEAKTKAVKVAAYIQAAMSRFQTVQIKAQNARLNCAKKAMAQAKKIFAAAVAYNPKKENFDFYTAVAESEEFDAVMAME